MFDRKTRRAILLAMMIGDGHVGEQKSRVKGYKSYRMSITHCAKQKEYLEYKRTLLCGCFQSEVPAIRKINNNGYEGYILEKQDKYLRIIHKRLYKNSCKVYSSKMLNLLTPLGLAIWFMDDGSCYYKRSPTGKVKSVETVLSTYCSEDEFQIIVKYFEDTWGVVWKAKRHKGKYSLRMGKVESVKFFDIIRRFIVPCMQYKIKC